MELSDYETNSLNKLGASIQEGKWSNDGLVQLIELCGSFLNIKTILLNFCRFSQTVKFLELICNNSLI